MLVARTLSVLTATMRLGGTMSVSLDDLQACLVPYPRMRFCVPSYVVGNNDAVTRSLFHEPQSSRLLSVQDDDAAAASKYVSCALMYKGDRLSFTDINESLEAVLASHKSQFVDFTSFLVGLSPHSALEQEAAAAAATACCMLANTTTIRHKFRELINTSGGAAAAAKHDVTELNEAREDLAVFVKELEHLSHI